MSVLSYAALCGLVVVESSVLLSIATAVRHIKEQYESDEDLNDTVNAITAAASAPPVPVPKFTARMFERPETLTERDLLGQRTVVLFIEARRTLHAPPHQFCATLAGLRGHSDQRVFVVSEGSVEDCREVQRRIGECGAPLEEFPMIEGRTEDGRAMTAVFELERTPAAVRVDAAGMIVKIGYQVDQQQADESSWRA